jgi:hypothetical protein
MDLVSFLQLGASFKDIILNGPGVQFSPLDNPCKNFKIRHPPLLVRETSLVNFVSA